MISELKRRWWLAALVLLLAIPLALLLSQTLGVIVRDVIAVPFLYLTWIGRAYVRSVPQALFWGGLLLFGLGLAITNLLIAISGRGRQEPQTAVAFSSSYDGKVRQLTSQIRYAARSIYFRRRLAQRLSRLALRALDYEEPYGSAQLERGLDALDAPPEVRVFLREGGRLISPSRPSGLIAWLKRRLREPEKVSAPRSELERVVQFLEERLEVL